MSFGGFRARQIVALVLTVAGIVTISFAWEIGEVARRAVSESRRDAEYIANSLVQHIQHTVAADPAGDPYAALRGDSDLRVTLSAATRFAPTVLYAAFCDSSGRAVVHTDPAAEGLELPRYEALPTLSGFLDPWRFLLELKREQTFYEHRLPLRMGTTSFGVVRVALGSAFIQHEVDRVMRRGIFVGLGQVLLALIAAFFLTRVVVGPVRAVHRGIEALRAGDFSYRIPPQGINEFAIMADALNEVGDRAREQLENTQHLRRAVEHLADGLLIVGPDREIAYINGIAVRLLGVDGDAALGRSLSAVFPPDHPVQRIADEILGGERDRMSLRAEISLGDGRSAIMAVGHRVDDGHDADRLLIELKDLSALEELQAVMDHSSTLSRLGEMAAGVAHEIRNPLNSIKLNLEPLRNGSDLDPGVVREAISTTTEQIARLDRAVTGFLRVARLQRLAMVPLDPVRLSEEVIGLLQPEATMAGMDLVLEPCGEPVSITGDREVLRQSLVNLVKNAIQAQPSSTGRITVRCLKSEGKIGIAVEDTGPGVDADLLPSVFDLYMTTKEAGTGVGLAFVRQAVEMHRGTVTLSSEPGRGATATMWLRAEPALEAPHVSV
jgi:PAS domain S-box-containing protein